MENDEKRKERICNSPYPRPIKTTKFPIRPHVTKKYDKAFKLIKEIFDRKR